MGYYLLNGEWDLREESLSTNINEYNRVVSEKVDWLTAQGIFIRLYYRQARFMSHLRS
jgi:hypothetical protein